MRKVLFILAVAIVTQAHATIRTVSNNPGTIAQFNTIQAAINAAVSGDTILVHGSPNNYEGFTIDNKKVTVIGPGWSPDKTLPHTANILSGITFTGAGASGTELQGLSIFGQVSIFSAAVSNIRFIRNRLYRSYFNLAQGAFGTITGYRFEGNWFDDAAFLSNNFTTLENFIFQNNIFYESGCCISGSIIGFVNTVNVLFDHNLFYGPSSGTRDVFTNNCRFVTLSNNVFVRRNAANGLSSAVFYNNITYLTGNDAPWTVNSNVNGGSNLAGTDPQLTAQPDVNNGTNNPLLNFTITAGPANNSGTDGKDRGLLYEGVGSLNWTNSRTSRIPYIYSMVTSTPTVAPGGSVTVTVEARTSN